MKKSSINPETKSQSKSTRHSSDGIQWRVSYKNGYTELIHQEFISIPLKKAAFMAGWLGVKRNSSVKLVIDNGMRQMTWIIHVKDEDFNVEIPRSEIASRMRAAALADELILLDQQDIKYRMEELYSQIRLITFQPSELSPYNKKRIVQDALMTNIVTSGIDFTTLEALLNRIADGTIDPECMKKISQAIYAERELEDFARNEEKTAIKDARQKRLARRIQLINEFQSAHNSRITWISYTTEFSSNKKILVRLLKNIPIHDSQHTSNPLYDRYMATIFWKLILGSGGEKDILLEIFNAFPQLLRCEESKVIAEIDTQSSIMRTSYENSFKECSSDEQMSHLRHFSKTLWRLSEEHKYFTYKMACKLFEYPDDSDWIVIHHEDREHYQIDGGSHFIDIWTGNICFSGRDDAVLLKPDNIFSGGSRLFNEKSIKQSTEADHGEDLNTDENEGTEESEIVDDSKSISVSIGLKQSAIDETNEITMKLMETIKGQEDACRRFAIALTAHHRGVSKGAILVRGSTGTGKTKLASEAARYLGNVPLIHVSSPSLVPEGIRGFTVSHALQEAIVKSNHKMEIAEKSVILFDEYDKITSSDQQHSLTISNNLLRLIDGGEWSFGHTTDNFKHKSIKTSQMLFILSGAWQAIEQRDKDMTHGYPTIGFTGNMKEKMVDDNVDLELPPELLGRISRIIRLKNHTESSLLSILNSPFGPWKNGLILLDNKYSPNSELNSSIAKKALESGLGARYLNTVIQGIIDKVIIQGYNNESLGIDLM